MSDANANFPGQVNLAGATDAMFLKVFSGEVAARFQTKSKFINTHQVRSLTHGKSASFPIVGFNTAAYHVPGTELLGTNIPQAESIITIDDLLVSHVFIPTIEEAKNHWDSRSAYVKQCADALVKAYDQNIAKVGVLAARSSGVVTGQPGGSAITNANLKTDSVALAKALFDAKVAMDEKDAPEEGRYVYLRPAEYALLAQNTTVINQYFGGQGAISDGTVLKIAGITVVMTNHLPKTNVIDGNAKYRGDFSNTVGLVMQEDAVGTVKLFDIATEMDYQVNRQGTLVVAKYAMGHGVLRPECSVELKIA